MTGLSFVPSGSSINCLMGGAECSLLSVSADKTIQLHQVMPGGKNKSKV